MSIEAAIAAASSNSAPLPHLPKIANSNSNAQAAAPLGPRLRPPSQVLQAIDIMLLLSECMNCARAPVQPVCLPTPMITI